LFRSPRRSGVAGFTLIEVLVALAVVAASLAAIGALAAVSMNATRSIEQRVAFRETLRAVMTAPPEGRDFSLGSASGDLAGYRWRVDISPFVGGLIDPQTPAPWEPEAVVVTMQSPTGQVLQINTVRLRRRPAQ
jgi:general secretion pathway protein I